VQDVLYEQHVRTIDAREISRATLEGSLYAQRNEGILDRRIGESQDSPTIDRSRRQQVRNLAIGLLLEPYF
jgi:hypothetical protein